jgi:hypothetical protein
MSNPTGTRWKSGFPRKLSRNPILIVGSRDFFCENPTRFRLLTRRWLVRPTKKIIAQRTSPAAKLGGSDVSSRPGDNRGLASILLASTGRDIVSVVKNYMLESVCYTAKSSSLDISQGRFRAQSRVSEARSAFGRSKSKQVAGRVSIMNEIEMHTRGWAAQRIPRNESSVILALFTAG